MHERELWNNTAYANIISLYNPNIIVYHLREIKYNTRKNRIEFNYMLIIERISQTHMYMGAELSIFMIQNYFTSYNEHANIHIHTFTSNRL